METIYIISILLFFNLLLFLIIYMDKKISELPDNHRFKKWWERNIIGPEE